jgi:uncharacterized protein (TIGR02147 family)
MTSKNKIDYRSFLANELKRRQSRNSAYSLRAFSRDLGINASRTTEILHGKEGLSVDRAVHIADQLKLGEAEKSLFIDLVQSEHSRSKISREAARERVKNRLASFPILCGDEEFLLLADWYNTAILELLALPIEHSAEVFARKLGMRREVIEEAIEKMLRIGYLERVNDKWQPREPDRSTTKDIPSKVVRQFHKQILERAALAIESKPIEERDYFSVLFAMNAQNMAIAKEKIAEFRRSLTQELNLNEDRDGVFCLALQFFELTERT